MPATLGAAKAELVGRFVVAGVPTIAKVQRVYSHQPLPGELQGLRAITVQTSGMDTAEYTFVVRIYVPLTGNSQLAQDDLDVIMEEADDLIDSRWTLAAWKVRVLDELMLMEATGTLRSTREDF